MIKLFRGALPLALLFGCMLLGAPGIAQALPPACVNNVTTCTPLGATVVYDANGNPIVPLASGGAVTANQGAPGATPWPVTTTTSQALLNNASSSGAQITVAVGGNYLIGPLTGTLGGATVTVTDVNALGQSSTVGPVLSATSTSGVCYAISAGDKLTATVTGGSPSGLFLPLGSVGSGGCAGTATASPYIFTPLAGAQTSVALSGTPLSLTVPTGAKYADFYIECTSNGTNNQCARYRDDGSAPSQSVGSGLASQQLLLGYSGNLAAIQWVSAAGSAGAVLSANYYK